jgi:3'-phosphoadenosine 5'-phosphosulfate sulfotransferase (PAPS reductase)/FAD synthetase
MKKFTVSQKFIKANIIKNIKLSKIAQQKIKKAIKELKRLNKTININTIAKQANISYSTSKKYYKQLEKYYIASWSGGKDSTLMIDLLLAKNEPLNEIIMINTGLEIEGMMQYVYKIKAYWQNKYNIKITIINENMGMELYNKWADGKFTKGVSKNVVRGFPYSIGMSYCTRELKINPMSKYIKNIKTDLIYMYIGICADEQKRIKESGDIYPLVKYKIEEKDVQNMLIKRGLHNQLYDIFSRTGCFLCPKASYKFFYNIYKYFPNHWQTIKELSHKYKLANAQVWKFKGYDISELELKFKNNTY